MVQRLGADHEFRCGVMHDVTPALAHDCGALDQVLQASGPVDVYVVEQTRNWEGSDVLWAGVDREAAFAHADSVSGSSHITVSRYAPTYVEVWTRQGYVHLPDQLAYEHVVLDVDRFKRTGDWVVRDLSP